MISITYLCIYLYLTGSVSLENPNTERKLKLVQARFRKIPRLEFSKELLQKLVSDCE